jgi:hypothetical protein
MIKVAVSRRGLLARAACWLEYLRIKNGKLESIECYFGARSSFPSAVSTGQE